MTWEANPEFYDRTAWWWGKKEISATDEQRAALINSVPGGPHHVLELGAGFGGTAAATAGSGHIVVALERSLMRAALARLHVKGDLAGRLTVLQANFLAIDFHQHFDVVVYWSGFGVGSEQDQQDVLGRMRRWVRPGGHVFLDVFDPDWWQAASGTVRSERGLVQELDYDAASRRLAVTYKHQGKNDAIRESVRCYSRAEILQLVTAAGFEAAEIARPGGAGTAYLLHLTPSGHTA